MKKKSQKVLISFLSFSQSFFDGWDGTKKKDKTKGRHDSLLSRKWLRLQLLWEGLRSVSARSVLAHVPSSDAAA